MKDRAKSIGAFALISGGTGAAFALAACCALPMLFISVGLSVYWLAPVAVVGERFNFVLTAIAILALGGGVATVLRAPGRCETGDLCARPWFRFGMIAFALAGAMLLLLAKTYA